MNFLEKRDEIEKELAKLPDFSKINYLEKLLKENLTIDIRRYCYLKLSEIYSLNKMFVEASKQLHKAAEHAINLKDKIDILRGEINLLIISGDYNGVTDVFRRLLSLGVNTQETKRIIKDMFKKKADEYFMRGNKHKATEAYEKMLGYLIEHSEEVEIKKRLLELYKEIGKRQDYALLQMQFAKSEF